MFKFRIHINESELFGAIALFQSIHNKFDAGAYIGGIMILGKLSVELIKAWRGNNGKCEVTNEQG